MDLLNMIRQTRFDRIRERGGADILRIHPEVLDEAKEESARGELYVNCRGEMWLCGMAVEETTEVVAFEIH